MPQYQISVPGQGTFVVDSPSELTDLQAWQAVQSQLSAAPAQPQKSTITGELVRGGKQLASSIRTGLESVVSPEQAAIAGVERGQKIGEEAGEGPSFAAVRKAYEEKGILPAAGEVISQIPRALAGQGAQLAAMAGGARLGAMAGSAVLPGPGTLIGGVLGAGATLLPQFMGANVERQAQEQLERGEPVSIDRTKAYGAAAGQAALEATGTAFVLGKRLVKGVLGIADDAALATAKAQQELAKAAARSVSASAGRGALRGTAEIPVEIAQAVLERAQAGLDLTSPEALSEYGENAYLAGLIGPTIGGVSGVAERSGARAKLRETAPAPEVPTAPPAPPVGALEFKPEPFIQFPDGTVAKRSEVEAYIKTLPEDQQMAMRAKLLGLAPQEVEKEPAPPAKALEYKPEPLIVYPDGSVAKRSEVDAYIQGLPEDEQIPARAKLLGMGEEATQVTPEMLRKLGIRGRAPIIQRLTGLELTDPKVTEELTNFAQQPFASPEVRGNIFGFLNTIKPIEAPAAPETPAAPAPSVTPPAPPAPFTAPGGFVSSLTLSPAYEGIEPLSVEDADFELEALQNSAEKGRLTPEQFASSEIGKRLDTAQIGFINEGLRTDPVGTITALRDRLKQATAAPAAPPVEPAPVVEAAAPAEKPTFEPKIVSRQPAPDGMEVHVFTTTDGYGTGLFDADAGQYVDGSITRFAGADTLPKAENKAAELLSKATPAAPAEPSVEPLGTRKEAQAFGKTIGAAQPYPGELRGRVNLPAQKAAKEGNFQGVLSALEKSKNVIVAEIAKRARALGTKIVIDDNAEETYTGPSTLMRQMSIDGAKMHLEALNKIRELAPQVDALPDGSPLNWLGFTIRNEKIKAIDNGKDAGSMRLEDIAKMGHSMFAPLSTGPIDIQTKEDFKRLQKAYEDLTSEYGENALQLTSTGSAEMRGVAGAYDAATDTIRVPEYTAKREEVLSHEIVHAQTVQAIANPTLRQKPIVARLNKLYEHVKKELEGRPGRAPYGIQSIQEFVAEGMGNPAFQFLLKKIKYENTSAWDSFVQTIANLIGVKRDTAFTELLSIYSDLTTEQKAAPKAEAPAVEAPAAKPAAEAPVGGFRRATAREVNSDNAQFVYDVGNGARLLFVPSQNGDVYVAAPGKGASLVVRTGDNRDNVIKTVDQFPDYIPENIRQIVLDYHKAVQGKTTDEEQTAVAMEMAEKIEALTAPKAEAPAAPPTLDTTGIKEVKGRHPQVQAAAKLLQDKKMTREEFEKYVDYYKPIEEIEAEKLLPPTSEQRMNETVNADKRDKINVPVADGTKVGLRMDLPARERGGSVVSIHEGKPGKLTVGKLMGFRSTGWLKDVTFEVRSQEKGLAVAAGAAKAPQQTVEGTWQNLSPEETYARVKELMKDPAWKQIGFDPSRHGYFYDRKTREPVVSASEMYQVGQFLLAKDVKYAPKTEFLYSLGKEQTKQLQDFQQTLRNLLNKFGLKDVGLNIVEGMDDAGSYSQQLIRIAAEEANPIRTLRHEAIHALRELGFFTDAQWKSLSKMAKDKWIDQYLKQRNVQGRPLKAGEESRYDAYMREYNGDMEKITEEAVADAFADFDATKPPAGLIQALLKRMKDLFQSIKSALTKVESPEQIFGKVEKGELTPGEKRQAGERKSVRDRATANFLRWFGDSKVVDEKGEPLVVYHGTNKDITDFKPGRGGGAIWFASTPELANLFVGGGRRSMGDGVRKGSTVYPVYLSIKKPLDLGNTAPQDNLSVAGVLRIAGLPADAQALRKIADANLSSGYAFVSPSNPDPAGYLVNEYLRPNSRASNTLDDPGLMAALLKAGFDGLRMKEEGATTYAAFRPEQIKSAIGNNGDYSLTNPDIRKSLGKTTDPGQQALETIRNMGMDVPKPDPTKLEKAKDIWQKAKEDPKLTAQSAMKAARDFMDKVETWAFSPDAKLNNDFRRAVIKDFKENEGVLGQLLEMSQSQAVHADALSSQFLIDGGLKYNDDLKKWESFQSKANFPALSKKLDEIGAKYGLTKEQIERVAHTYLVAKRLPGLIERNKNLDAEIAAEQANIKPDKTKIKNLEDKKVFISDKQLEQIEPGLSLVKNIPELNQVVDMWNEIRKNTIDVMVNSGLWSPEYAQAMWDNMDYVPYFREDQIENEAGPQEFIRGLQVKSKEFQLKGSEDAVHDVFDNMIRWTQYAINRSVRAHKALQMVDNVKDIQIGDRKMAVKVTEEKRGMNIARVFRDGKQELYDMADPMYVQAFSAIQNVSIPTLKFMARVSNVLRQSVVLYPLFSVAQVPQDAFAAMFTSGLKTQHALKIPILAVKEFIKTLNKTSQTHETLKRFGATGVRDFSATVIRDDAEIYAGLKPPRGGWGKTKEFLSHISMAADNAVRQAVYEASMQQGVKQSEAIEKAFDLINFRRKGTSKMLNILGQTVPFFYAYLSAQRVALKVLTGTGISPTDRKEAFQTLATTSAAVATLSLLYAMANADDEDYMETPAAIRDRTLTIPGSGGVRIPLRPDFFLFPKIIAEHTYLLLSEQGYQDAAKFRTSMKDALISAIASPTPFPTAIKPAIEVAINYDFFQGKPLIGNFEKQKDLERQFRDSTSEFAKLLGATGMISPIAADHMIRGMFGSFGGLFLYGTNQFLHSDPDVPRPELSAGEMLTALPGTSGLLKRPQESALKNDFYTLRDEVEKAVNTFNDIKTRSPQGMEDFLEDEKQMARYMLGKPVDKINRELAKIRRQITIITNMPENQMSAEDKAENIRQLREFEREYLKSVDVKALREMAKI